MGSSFEVVGVARISSTGRSLRLELHNLPYSGFTEVCYVGIRDVEEVLAKHKKNATVYMLKPKERNMSNSNDEL